MAITPPDPIEANVDYRYDGCYQSMVLVLLQRVVDASGGGGTGLATEAKQDSQITLATAANALLTSLDGKDFATQTTLEAVRVLIASLDGKDYATETTAGLIKTVLDNIKLDTAKLDVNLSTRASETTLALVEAITSQMTFTGGDLNVNASVSLPAGLSTEAKQDAQIVLETAANALLTSLDGKDYATQTTLEAVRVLIASLDAKDYATETTLAAIKAQTDLLNFTGAKLRTTGEDASGGGGVSVFGDTGGYSNLTPDGTNQLVLAADTDFKEVILYHENKKQGWVKFGGGAAVVGEGFPIKKKQPWILDRCRGEIRIIFESGYDAKDLQINTVKL